MSAATSPDQVFLPANERRHLAAYTTDNAIEFFTDDRALFARMRTDMATATGPMDFVYLANWWIDLDIPLGDPYAQPRPPSLRRVLQQLALDKPVDVLNASPEPANTRDTRPGTQVCAMVWQQKSTSQVDPSMLVAPLNTLFGGQLLGRLNRAAVSYINSLGSGSAGILDDRTLAAGCHHQKLLIVGRGNGLVAYCGSADFHADRLYRTGSPDAVNPPDTTGAPLSDVALRIVGPAAQSILDTFLARWLLHPDAPHRTLPQPRSTP